MTSKPDTLSMLETANECSISGLFQELWNKGFRAPQQQSTEPLKFGDTEGSDFKRLLHKKDKTNHSKSSSLSSTSSTPVFNKPKKIISDRQYHQDSPDFRPIVYVNNDRTAESSRLMQLGTSLYSFLFQHEDRYFNHDRDELSKDIFPVGQQAQR